MRPLMDSNIDDSAPMVAYHMHRSKQLSGHIHVLKVNILRVVFFSSQRLLYSGSQ
jgi:hypothetical protein